jgi:peptidoglycan biosynthesis protein MviN/MurJ (putative lipid II flippase)
MSSFVEMESKVEYVLTGLCVAYWLTMAMDIYITYKRKRYVKGTHARYVFTTYAYIVVAVGMVHTLTIAALNMFLVRTFWVGLWVAISLPYFYDLYVLLKEGDDNWFNRQWKKLKNRVKSCIAQLTSRPAFVAS